jgi:hypothetical protein
MKHFVRSLKAAEHGLCGDGEKRTARSLESPPFFILIPYNQNLGHTSITLLSSLK